MGPTPSSLTRCLSPARAAKEPSVVQVAFWQPRDRIVAVGETIKWKTIRGRACTEEAGQGRAGQGRAGQGKEVYNVVFTF